jgi:imidazolonepropionase-like amidohydrolase
MKLAVLVAAALLSVCTAAGAAQKSGTLLVGTRVFDGREMLSANAVLVNGGKVVAVGSRAALQPRARKVMAFRNATVLPGFIDLHVHAAARASLKLGVTTIRNLGEPLLGLPPSADKAGWQRVRSAGPIVSVPGGYPRVWWGGDIQIDVTSPDTAGGVVNTLVDHGADELAHMPCGESEPETMRALAEKKIPVVGTFDVERRCPFKVMNARAFVQAGGKLLYGTDFSLVPPGIDVREAKLMSQAGLTPTQVLAAGTSEAGKELGERLGVLETGAPADVIVVRGDPRRNLAALGRVLAVIAGGKRAF